MGGFFDFLKGGSAENVVAENHTEIESNIAPSGFNVEASESAKVISEVKQRKREKDDTGKRAFTFEESTAAQIASEQAKILDAILDPKVWRGAVAAPGDAMVVITGKEYWELSEDERDTLAKTGAATARCFAVVDPKWLALTLFGFSVLSIYGSRTLKSLTEMRTEKKMAAVRAQNAP